MLTIDKDTVLKYDVAGPRYTSYPTAPQWTDNVEASVYAEKLQQFSQTDKTLSLYIHIPFCQTLCSFCACNVVIRPHEEKYGDQYIDYLCKEVDLLTAYIGKKRKIKQFHWGGGTPTFLNEAQIERLFKKVDESFDMDRDGEIAIEIDPRTIDKAKVKKLKELGFNRVSMGVQDFDELVQKNVNRIQPYSVVKEFNDWCRELNFHSVNFDLIYGLPDQTIASFADTVDKVIALRPDRIALYSFAYVPWLKKHQNKINRRKLPVQDDKLEIFLNSREQFLNNGYQAIAMDHFALADDELAQAFNNGTLYRNFMGYTVKPADEYVGLGMTAIGFIENTFIQNYKTLRDYCGALDENELPCERGKILSDDDRMRQWVISSLMCHFVLDKDKFYQTFNIKFDEYFSREQGHIVECIENGLIIIENDVITATELGKIFIRNVCMGFDWYLKQKWAHKQFSKTI